MLKYSVIFVFLGLVGKSLSAPDWSQAARGKRGESDDIVIPTCQVPSKISADDSIVKTIVDFHNAKRREESAKNMAELIWDETLADLAQEWAEQCTWAHGMTKQTCRGDKLGQNLYTGQAEYSPEEIMKVLTSWHGEKANYILENVTCTSPPCSHYTQMVWHDTYAIGCGYHTCPTLDVGEETPRTNALVFACDYHKTGNWKDEKPFVKVASEETCNDCATLLNGVSSGAKCSDGLCAICDPAADDCDSTCADTKPYESLCQALAVNCKKPESTYYPFMVAMCRKTCNNCPDQFII
ncbi:hypothetical protein CAPTEDRAFT_209756 [Capitella teleta]|uniref:SCP domain-containing protein n=1 Tax=Capitella teleta TaxID=283909 RepID=R7TRH7_CAPTE|nr:hypothetical protein CAPTEDRAFT_209756 [Capitella teleta]|eukprot:ELT96244.1 hypothetical protein CAPTEDRAFT_209756 [Capitella teleta]